MVLRLFKKILEIIPKLFIFMILDYKGERGYFNQVQSQMKFVNLFTIRW